MMTVISLIYNYYPEEKPPENRQFDLLVVKESENKMMAYADDKLFKPIKSR